MFAPVQKASSLIKLLTLVMHTPVNLTVTLVLIQTYARSVQQEKRKTQLCLLSANVQMELTELMRVYVEEIVLIMQIAMQIVVNVRLEQENLNMLVHLVSIRLRNSGHGTGMQLSSDVSVKMDSFLAMTINATIVQSSDVPNVMLVEHA